MGATVDPNVQGFSSGDIAVAETSALALARSGALELMDLLGVVNRLQAAGNKEGAKALYRTWLDHTTSPHAYLACFNLAVLVSADGDYAGAEKLNRRAIEINPDLLQARLNLGNNLEALGREDETLEQWRIVLAHPAINLPENKALLLHALNHIGRVLETRREFPDALQILERSLQVDPDQPDVLLHAGHLRQKQCQWPLNLLRPKTRKDDMVVGCSPLALLAATNDPELQLQAARWFVEYKFHGETKPLAPAGGYRHDKIRIGYLSSDFCLHAVSLLTVELYELHDRERFEVYGFCWSREDGTAMRTRVINAMDHFIKIGSMSDEEAARCIRSHEIDILIDLQGLTSGARPLILSHRPAPVQATYLGFPGTTGIPWIDYVIADRYLIPEAEAPYYSEKPLYLPNCFQASDSKRPVGALPTRADNHLPENAFVFCIFNNNYKFTPELFAVWMRILKKVPGSVLWLLADNEWARENLIRTAKKHGIKKERLIFASRVAPHDYLARYQIADLFLDTFPFNGGTTANDALFMGLPLLTLSGRTFASRMAGSLLTALGLSELITTSLPEYEAKAVELGKNRARCRQLKEKLAAGREASRIFDTKAFVAEYEDALAQVVPTPEVGAETGTATRLYMIAYSRETLSGIPAGYQVMNNLQNPRPDWMEYWPIRNYLLASSLEEHCLYGFFSPKFPSKVGLGYEAVLAFLAASGPDPDEVHTFSPQPDMGAFFINVFEQNETFDPGFKGIAQRVFDAVGYPVNLDTLVMDSRQVVFSNYIVAGKRFWGEWLALCEKIFALCEAGTSPLAAELNAATTYNAVPRKVFLIERIASLLLASGKWQVRPYNTFRCAWSGTPMATLRQEAVVSDALKHAYNDLKCDEYLQAFYTLRNKTFFGQKG